MNNKGISLIELLLSTVLAVIVAIFLSFLFPKVSVAIIQNRQRMVAAHLAESRMEDIQKMPYALVPLTTQANFPAANVTCDCNQVADMATMPAGTPIVQDNVTYTPYVCINYEQGQAGGIWTSSCPPNSYPAAWVDPGVKNTRVHMTWTAPNGSINTIDLVSEVAQS